MNKLVGLIIAAYGLMIGVMLPSTASATPAQDRELAMAAYNRGDPNEAFRLTLAAARANLPSAQSFVAWLYGNGQGTAKDTAKAMFWLNKAVENRDPYAYSLMSITYLQGEWVEKDIQKSYDYAQRATNAGYDTKHSFAGGSLISEIGRVAGPDNFNCMFYGFRQGTPNFAQCLMQQAQAQQLAQQQAQFAKQQAQYAQQQYQLQAEQYQRQLAAEQQALEREKEAKREAAWERLRQTSEDLACPKVSRGMFAEPVAGCGRNKHVPPAPVVNVIVRPY
jgi:hypothetical protein